MPHEPITIESHHRSSAPVVRILLADDFAPWRLKVRSFLERETDWEILAEACDGVETLQKTVEMCPDVVVSDLTMPLLNGIEVTRRLRQLSPDCKVIILTQYADEGLKTVALEAGAAAYVVKTKLITELIPAIQAALGIRCD